MPYLSCVSRYLALFCLLALSACDTWHANFQIVNQRATPIEVCFSSRLHDTDACTKVPPFGTSFVKDSDVEGFLWNYHPYHGGIKIKVIDLQSGDTLIKTPDDLRKFMEYDNVQRNFDDNYDITNGRYIYTFIVSENDVIVYWRPKHKEINLVE